MVLKRAKLRLSGKSTLLYVNTSTSSRDNSATLHSSWNLDGSFLGPKTLTSFQIWKYVLVHAGPPDGRAFHGDVDEDRDGPSPGLTSFRTITQ